MHQRVHSSIMANVAHRWHSADLKRMQYAAGIFEDLFTLCKLLFYHDIMLLRKPPHSLLRSAVDPSATHIDMSAPRLQGFGIALATYAALCFKNYTLETCLLQLASGGKASESGAYNNDVYERRPGRLIRSSGHDRVIEGPR